MAKKGRKDTGQLYEVFRKITSQKGEQAFDIITGTGEESSQKEHEAVKAAVVEKPGRAFIVGYNTAVIIFIAFIIVGLWLYLIGYKWGRESVIQRKSKIEKVNIPVKKDTDIISLHPEIGRTAQEEWYTVEVYSVPRDKLESLKKNIRGALIRQHFETFIATSEKDEGYVLWVGQFPKESPIAEQRLEQMRVMPAKSGGRAFKNPKFVIFDKTRIVE